MSTNRMSAHFDSPAPAAPPAATGFALCPIVGAPQALMMQFAALQQAYRDQLAAAEQRAFERVMQHALRAEN